jgi:hypothetical protein
MVSDVRRDTQPWHNGGMRLRTALVFGIGYLLGAKAGRDRYEQIRRLYLRATSNPQVRQVIDQGKDIVDSQTAHLREIAADQLRSAGTTIRGDNGQPT